MTNARKLVRALRSLTIRRALFAATSGPATGFILNPGDSVTYNFDFSSAGHRFPNIRTTSSTRRVKTKRCS